MCDRLTAHERIEAKALAARLRAVKAHKVYTDECEFLAKEIDECVAHFDIEDGRRFFGYSILNGQRQLAYIERNGLSE